MQLPLYALSPRISARSWLNFLPLNLPRPAFVFSSTSSSSSEEVGSSPNSSSPNKSAKILSPAFPPLIPNLASSDFINAASLSAPAGSSKELNAAPVSARELDTVGFFFFFFTTSSPVIDALSRFLFFFFSGAFSVAGASSAPTSAAALACLAEASAAAKAASRAAVRSSFATSFKAFLSSASRALRFSLAAFLRASLPD
mmetsp:Transcript_122875/g.192882  ORF Transcript_122875/g.192882 Transcript_122875/m.192882 type:complete len:200 (+) Transcript_122875:58-657(+)